LTLEAFVEFDKRFLGEWQWDIGYYGVTLYYKDRYFIISKRPFEKWADYDIVGFVEKLYGGRENIVDWV